MVNTLRGHDCVRNGQCQVNSAVFSPDGQTILTASRDKTAKLWDNDGNLITTLNQDSCWHVHIKDYHCGLTSAVFSPDGTKIITT
ncbi:MAG: hypothetical protein F6K38_33525, partial [Moorea sp. SIO3B2]